MPNHKDNQGLNPALSELESALGDLAPVNEGTLGEGSGQRDQLMFAMGRAAAVKRARRSQFGTALVALLVGTLVTLPWRLGSTPAPSGNSNTLVTKDDGKVQPPDRKVKLDTLPRVVIDERDTVAVSEVNPLRLLEWLGARPAERSDDDPRYVSIRDRVLEHGVDGLPEGRTGIAGGAGATLMNRFGRSNGSF